MTPRKKKSNKKTPKTAYYFFLLDFKKQEGSNYDHLTAMDVQEKAGKIWNSLTREERAQYEEMAQQERENKVKYNSLGVPITEQERMEQEKKDNHRLMVNNIIAIVNDLWSEEEGLRNSCFYFVHLNCFARTETGYVVPAELGISEFSLQDGVRRVFSCFINIRAVPMGYSFMAKDIAEKSHRIPVPSCVDPSQANEIYMKVMRFLHGLEVDDTSDDEYLSELCDMPIMYTTNTEMEIVQECFGAVICERKRFDVPTDLKIYNIEILFHEMLNLCSLIHGDEDMKLKLCLAEVEFEKDRYSFVQKIACEFHETADAIPFCSRSKVTRWAYIISDFVCPKLNIKMIPGKHCPANTSLKELEKTPKKEFTVPKISKKAPPKTERAGATSSQGCKSTDAPKTKRVPPQPSWRDEDSDDEWIPQPRAPSIQVPDEYYHGASNVVQRTPPKTTTIPVGYQNREYGDENVARYLSTMNRGESDDDDKYHSARSTPIDHEVAHFMANREPRFKYDLNVPSSSQPAASLMSQGMMGGLPKHSTIGGLPKDLTRMNTSSMNPMSTSSAVPSIYDSDDDENTLPRHSDLKATSMARLVELQSARVAQIAAQQTAARGRSPLLAYTPTPSPMSGLSMGRGWRSANTSDEPRQLESTRGRGSPLLAYTPTPSQMGGVSVGRGWMSVRNKTTSEEPPRQIRSSRLAANFSLLNLDQ